VGSLLAQKTWRSFSEEIFAGSKSIAIDSLWSPRS
jgi:hypothetical protein